jgi:hypothetical protein
MLTRPARTGNCETRGHQAAVLYSHPKRSLPGETEPATPPRSQSHSRRASRGRARNQWDEAQGRTQEARIRNPSRPHRRQSAQCGTPRKDFDQKRDRVGKTGERTTSGEDKRWHFPTPIIRLRRDRTVTNPTRSKIITRPVDISPQNVDKRLIEDRDRGD